MSVDQLPLDGKDVEALLLSDIFVSDEHTCIPDAAEREVTLRGDLRQMHLADIFQSLGMAKMEGVLRIRNPVECREVYFRDGFVRCFVPPRVEVRRLGVQLIQAGLVTPAQLRAMLMEQRREAKSLRHLLVENSVLPADDVEGLFTHQAGEDIYGLFAWGSGAFEFYKGPPTEPAVLERFEQTARFDVNAVLMEVARRSDEWEVIRESLHSIDELVVHGAKSADDLKGDDAEIYNAVDGLRPVRLIAQSMLTGLFEVCRVIADLLQREYVRFVTVEEGLAVARDLAERSQPRMAVALLQTLAARPGPLSAPDLQAIASVLAEAGEPKLAAETLLAASDASDDPAVVVALLREALGHQPRSLDITLRLRQVLNEHQELAQRDELRSVTDTLCDALVTAERYDEALGALTDLDQLAPGDTRIVFRRAVVLHRAGRREDAINALLELAETFKAQRAREQLAAVYDQILRIDSHRKDIQKARRNLRISAAARRVRVVAIATVSLGLGFAGVAFYRNVQTRRALAEATSLVEASLNDNDDAAALRAIDQLEQREGANDQSASLRARVTEHVHQRREAARRLIEGARGELLGQAAAEFENDNFAGALQMYAGIIARGGQDSEEQVLQAARTRFELLLGELAKVAERLPAGLPPPPDSLQTAATRRRALEGIVQTFQERDRLRAESVARVLDTELQRKIVPEALTENLRRTCATILEQFRLADIRRAAYAGVQSRLEAAQRLQPLLVEAREHEAAFRFRAALESFRILAREHIGDDQLKTMFIERVEANAKLVRLMELMEQATSSGDFAAAQGQLRALRTARPDVPFDRLVKMPLSITSNPPGARVFMGNVAEPAGKTPLRTSYVPGNVTTIRLELKGYAVESATVTGDTVGEVRATLTKLPSWTLELTGPVTQSPAAAAGRVFVVDRAGNVTALDAASGRQVWQLHTHDLSGLLPRPAVESGRVVVASVDGTLRCCAAADGRLLWSREELPVEVAPVMHEGVVVVATVDGRLVGVDIASGRPRFEQPLRRPATAPLVYDGKSIFLVAADGEIVSVAAADGRELWRTSMRQLVVAAPTVVGNLLVVVSDEGRAAAFDVATGANRWTRSHASLISVSPVVCDGTLFLAADRRILAVDVADGQANHSLSVDETISVLGVAGQRLLVGTNAGVVHCFDVAGRRPVSRLRGSGRVAVSVGLPGGTTVVGFEGKVLHAYRDLP